jgi:hypothetical protein
VGFLWYLPSEEFHPQFWICPKLGVNLKVRWKQYTTSRGNQTSVRGEGCLLWHWFLSGVSSPVLDLPYLSPYTAAWTLHQIKSFVRIKSCKSWELILSFIQTVLPSFAHFTSHTQIGDETGLCSIKQRRSHLRSGQCFKLKPCNFEKSPCEYHDSKNLIFFLNIFL